MTGSACGCCGGQHRAGPCPTSDGADSVAWSEPTPVRLRSGELEAHAAVGEYRVERKLGEGGMGVVYRGIHPLLGRKVAIKILNEEYARSDEAATRFLQEARAASQLRHRNIVDVFAFGQLADGRYYQVMELLEGQSLAQHLEERGVLEPAAASAILESLLAGLELAHRKGIIHRDLKPDNVFLCAPADAGGPPEVKILDFGLAKHTGGDGANAVRTRTGVPMGTPAYMSPEQCRATTSLDARTDLYSLGVMIYEMFTGRLPFRATSYLEVMTMHLTEPPPPPSASCDMPAALEQVILKALAKKPEERFGSASELRAALVAACAAAAGWSPRPPREQERTRSSSPTAFGGTLASDPTLAGVTSGAPAVEPHRAHAESIPPVSVGRSSLQLPRTRARSIALVGAVVAALALAIGLSSLGLRSRARAPEETRPDDRRASPPVAERPLGPGPGAAPPSSRAEPAPLAAASAEQALAGVAAEPHASVRIEPSPPGRVLVDGILRGEGARVLVSDLRPGEHLLRVESPGRKVAERRLSLKRDELLVLPIELRPIRRRPATPAGPAAVRDLEQTINPYAR